MSKRDVKVQQDLKKCGEAAEKALGLTPFDEQLAAAVALCDTKIVEMKTGEGKTLSAVFAAYLLKQKGRRVHIFTFNDYLAKRDYNWMRPVYELLGVSVSLIVEQTPFEERKKAYADSDVIYSTVKECGFDFLRDFMVFDASQKVHPDDSFDFAIFDEADSVLIDEARIPLVIAGDVDATVSDGFMEVFDFVKEFTEDDYDFNSEGMSVFLTESGVAKTEERFKTDNLYDEENIDLRCNIEICTKALFYLEENQDYIVKDGQIKLIDALTGRVAQHRLLPGALQAAVEAKHGLKVTERGIVTGIIPIQFFARQYKDIAGMTGTAKSSADEFELLYGLQVEKIRPHNPSLRVDHPPVVYFDNEAKWDAVVKETVRVHAKHQPVLIGTSSIEESENLADTLQKAGIKNVSVLNAKNDEMEADIIKNAGQADAVTVSTNMAGRGIDIKLGGADEDANNREQVIKAGGLCIIGTAMYEAARMNEQLNGRAGRQGDIGETRLFIALDDEIMEKYGLKKLVGYNFFGKSRYPKPTKEPVTDKVVIREIERIQRIAQGALLNERKRLLKFTLIGEKHRDIIFKKRLEYLSGDEKVKFGKFPEVSREVMLSAINELWCDYLEYTSELRTGIHLRAVAGRIPAEEYNIDCEKYFAGMQERLTEKVESILENADGEICQKLFKPKNTRTFLVEESGDELVRRPILLNIFSDSDEPKE